MRSLTGGWSSLPGSVGVLPSLGDLSAVLLCGLMEGKVAKSLSILSGF